MNTGLQIALLTGAALVLAGCSSGGARHHPRQSTEQQFRPPQAMLLAYDANHDGSVTRAEMEAGLKADFAAADKDHNGTLDLDEVRPINEARWRADASTASPLVDWNHDGVVDFDEFAGTARSLFDQLDRDGNGILSPQELRGQHPGAKKQKKSSSPYPDRGQRRRSGSR